jgi:hypothetical protein
MKKCLLPILLLLSAIASNAEQIIIRDVKELIEPSDLIARVMILNIRSIEAEPGHYGKIALAKVVESIKGLKTGTVFELENELVNVVCPNISYREREEVLLFAKALPNGHYVTVYADAGKIAIEGQRVNKQPFKKGQSYRSAVAEIKLGIRQMMSKKRKI